MFRVEEYVTDMESNTSPRRRLLMSLKTQLLSEAASVLSAAGWSLPLDKFKKNRYS